MTDTETPKPPSSRSEIIQQIAKTLVDRRKVRGLTLEKACQSIKIRMPYLQAIEKGEWDQLPGEVYVRGFVRRYAGHLGLDGDRLIAPYLETFQTVGKKAAAEEAASGGVKPTELSRTHLAWLGVAVIFFLGLFKMISQERAAQPTAAKTAAAKQQKPAPAEPKKEEKAPASDVEKHQLEIFSPFPLWVRVSSEDRNFEGFIPQGATWTWKGEGKFTVRLGHTRQVTLLFDGKQLALAEDLRKLDLP